MDPELRRLRLYGAASEHPPPPWASAEERLAGGPLYWVDAGGSATRHPRPVWGVWHEGALYLSIGSPAIRQALAADPEVCVHLESGTDVVLVHGRAEPAPAAVAAIEAYDAKYDWRYDEATYGPLTRVDVREVLAWRTAGPAGRDGFVEAGAWRFEPAPGDGG